MYNYQKPFQKTGSTGLVGAETRGIVFLWGLIQNNRDNYFTNLDQTILNYNNIFKNYKLDYVISTWNSQYIKDESLFLDILKSEDPTEQYLLEEIHFPYTKEQEITAHIII